jgi:hypothetical protein
MIKQGTLVCIEWEDSYNGDHRWQPLSDIPKEPLQFAIKTTGFVVAESKKNIQLTMSITDPDPDGERQICDLFTIPKGCIREIKQYG